MKNRSILIVTALLMAVSCSNDEIMHLQQGAPIEFRAVMNRQTKATPFTAVNLTSFNVTAWDEEDDSYYYEQVDYTRGDDGSYTSDMDYYWPVTGSLVFYAYSPKASAGNGITRISEKSFSVTPTASVDDQVDLIFAKNSGSKTINYGTGVELNFRHTMADIHIHVKNTENKADFTVTGWKIVGADGTAVFTFNDTVTNTNTSAQNAANTFDRDMWSDNDDDYSVSYVKTFTTGRDINASTTNGQALDGSAILIPQYSTKATRYSGSDPTSNPLNGAYIAIQYEATDASTSSVMVPAGTWGCWPVTFDWKPGYRYNYTIDLADFGYKETGEDELDPVYFDHTVINFVELSVDPWQPDNDEEASLDVTLPGGVHALRFRTVNPSDVNTLKITDVNNYSHNSVNVEYSKDEGQTWTALTTNTSISFGAGTDLYIRGKYALLGSSSHFSFGFNNVPVSCDGDVVWALKDYSAPSIQDINDASFPQLFLNCRCLVSAPSLNATRLSDACYEQMFKGCTNLVTPPSVLPATTLKAYCYSQMFEGCTSLASAPVIKADTVGIMSCNLMFSNCSSLTSAPELNAMVLGESGYSYMFNHCTGLTDVPDVLPATVLADGCYNNMFCYCTSLKTAPAIMADVMASDCCSGMFSNCSSLETLPVMNATTLASSCYYMMFSGCTGLTDLSSFQIGTASTVMAYNSCSNMLKDCDNLVKAPQLPSLTMAEGCYFHMFDGCDNLKEGPSILPATTLSRSCYSYMFNNCPALERSVPMSATTVDEYSCIYMYTSCTGMKQAAEMPAMNLAESCYEGMFYMCSGLETPPSILPATTLTSSCYASMFDGCSSLQSAPVLPATTLASGCYSRMFKGCGSLEAAPVLPARHLVARCYTEMFRDCSNLNYVKALFEDESLIYQEGSSWYVYTDNWLYGADLNSGTFVRIYKDDESKYPPSQVTDGDCTYFTTSYIPSTWTILTATE